MPSPSRFRPAVGTFTPAPPPVVPPILPPPPPPSEGAPPSASKWSRVGNVPVRSWRGIVGLLLVGIPMLAVLASPAVSLYYFFSGKKMPEQTVTADAIVTNIVFLALLFLLLPILAVLVTRPRERGAVPRRLGLEVDRKTPKHLLLGLGVALAAILLLMIVGLILDAFHVDLKQSEVVTDIGKALNPALLFLIPLSAALSEEVFFRGLLQPRFGIFVTSVLFALVHLGYGTVLQLLAPFVLGLVFGYLRKRTGRLWAPIAAHFSFNFIELSLLY